MLLCLTNGKAAENQGSMDLVFDMAVNSLFGSVPEEHGLTEDTKTVPPVSPISVSNAFRQRKNQHIPKVHATSTQAHNRSCNHQARFASASVCCGP